MTEHSGKIVIDLDGVLAGPKTTSYDDCEPNRLMIARLHELRRLGFTIAIHTSRNVRSHEHNLGKLIADTSLSIARWLEKHNVPYDELWVNKPWVGKTGFYVDDRAVSPKQFLQMQLGELMTMARSNAFNYETSSVQGWLVLFTDETDQLDQRFISCAKENRDKGFRTLVVGPISHLAGGHSVALRRAGVKILRMDYNAPLESLGLAARYLIEEELAQPNSPIVTTTLGLSVIVPSLEEVELTLSSNPGTQTSEVGLSSVFYAKDLSKSLSREERDTPFGRAINITELIDGGKVKSRHFNTVRVVGGTVYKTTTDADQAVKLDFERQWLQTVDRGSVKNVTAIPGGYSSDFAADGNLADFLARKNVAPKNISKLAFALRDALWTDLDSLSVEDTATEESLDKEHVSLYVKKSISRLDMLKTMPEIPSIDKVWTVNGVGTRSARTILMMMIAEIPVQTAVHRGVFHGDFCPGNIVIEDLHGLRPKLRVIDPRGSVDGQTLALYGDVRYDMGKLSHSLKWGYDTILEDWYDCDYVEDDNKVEVNLSLWDELPEFETPARLRLWEELNKGMFIVDGPSLHSDEIQLIAALQLITCAPLHIDDPKRATALIARGLQAGIETLKRIEDNK